MLEHFASLFPETCRRYYEPFLGGGAVALAIAPRCGEMILSDKNSCLINAWQCVREDPEALALSLYYHKHRHERGGRSYFDYMKDLYNDRREEEGTEAASRFIFLNKACFNGSWRANKKGQINITLGDRCCLPLLKPVADRLAGDVAIVACEFDIIDSAGPGDLIYLDPPYYEGHRRIASEYSVGRFTEDDRTRMTQLAARASSRGACVVGSDIDSPYTRALYKASGFKCKTVSFSYAIGGYQKSRAISSELIYHNKL